MVDWEVIELTSFKWERDMTTFHMSHLIKKCMSNSLPTMKILQRQVHAITNLCPRCVLAHETIHHLYQWTHNVNRGRWTASVDTLHKWLEARNTDPDIAIHFYITLHSEVLRIAWPSIILGLIPTYLTGTQQTYFNHIGSRKTGLKWANQLITQI